MAKPPHRPPGRGGGTKTMLTWALLLLLVAAAQSQSLSQSRSTETVSASTQTTVPSSHRRIPAGRSPAEIPLLKHDITTVKFRSTDDDSINHKFNALAPAKEIDAVRAPLVQSAESLTGLSALTPARLLHNWEAENIVLLATVDGAIHARDRHTGDERWSLGIPDSPMIQTMHHCYNRSDQGEAHCDHDYIFIVEPSKDGNLYIQHKNPEIGLQRLGVTVRDLAGDTPQFLEDPPLVTIAEQETTAYVVDAASGNVLQQFSKRSAFVNDNQERSCRRLSGFELDDPACDPIGTINLGRVEYTITISNKLTSELLCTIKFAEWVPNKGDSDLQEQYVAPLDNHHIQTFYNGRIMALNSNSEDGKIGKFTHKMNTPVARVFDVVRPLDSKDDTANLVLLSRPIDSPLLSPAQHWRNDMQRLERVFVNRTEAGVWYAMSELSYPGVTSGAAPAHSHWNYDSSPIDFEHNLDDIIGVHVLRSDPHVAPIRLTIDGRSPGSDVAAEAEASLKDPKIALNPELLSQFKSNWSLLVNVVLLGLFVLVAGIQLRVPTILRLQRFLRKAGIEVAVETERHADTGKFTPQPVDEDVIPVVDTTNPQEPVAEAVAEAVDIAAVTPARSRTPSAATAASSPKKEQKPDEENDNSSDGESDDEKLATLATDLNEANETGVELKKRHAKRGKRGGRKNKKKKQMEPGAMDEAESLTAEIPTKDGLLQVGKLRIDTKEDKCLGRGSNGTAVFPGTLDGREVAVKRLIRSSNSLAAKEIKHLLSSDENQHVIRYFGKEESQHFTYIALDLFTTSLDQFVERPLQYPTLVRLPEGYDVKDCLTQITDGVSHLHSLKLVHRDIKPQNVLVKAVKSSRPTIGPPKLHFVISDFGLCKPLEEGPESTFAPTANHTAAGTTGWRAPELLVNYRDGAAPNTTSTTSTTHSNDGSTSLSIDRPVAGTRRATKAIDIFSLGCVFYYVMTQGRHPFDIGGTSLGRDLNIKDNRFSTEDLRLHSYSFDADDLIMQMLKHDPRDRPDTTAILKHPYFWPVEDKLDFLCDVSDCYEKEKNSIKNIHDENAVRTPSELDAFAELAALERLGPDVIGSSNDWLRALPRSFVNEMGKQRKYTGSKMIDLLRVIRNKRNHFLDLPDDVRGLMTVAGVVGASGGNGDGNEGREKGMPSVRGYYEFWEKRFPSLLVNCHMLLVERGVVGGWRMERYF